MQVWKLEGKVFLIRMYLFIKLQYLVTISLVEPSFAAILCPLGHITNYVETSFRQLLRTFIALLCMMLFYQATTSPSACMSVSPASQPSRQLLFLAQPSSSSSLMRTKNGRPDVLLAGAKSKINICLHLFQDERKPLIGWLVAQCSKRRYKNRYLL